MAGRHVSTKGYLLSWLVLLALTILTLVVSQMLHGTAEVVVALTIAGIKGTLVAAIFMHLAEQRFANRFVFVVAILYVVILVGLTAADVVMQEPIEFRPPISG